MIFIDIFNIYIYLYIYIYIYISDVIDIYIYIYLSDSMLYLSFQIISYKYKINEKLTNYVTNYDDS